MTAGSWEASLHDCRKLPGIQRPAKAAPAPAAAASEAAANLSIHAGASPATASRRLTADASSNAASTHDIRACMIGVLRA